jgi:prepilin-type N-terminal cleavage/methylation domain-containing protein
MSQSKEFGLIKTSIKRKRRFIKRVIKKMKKFVSNKPISDLCPDNAITFSRQGTEGFSLIELICSMVITLIILGVAVAAFSGALGSRERESSKTDAITSTQAALNIMSREVGNSGYGLNTNGIVVADSTNKRLHIRANVVNSNSTTSDAGEDITFYWDSNSQSVVRYDASNGSTSGIINRVSDVDFTYYNYASDGTFTTGAASADTGRVNIRLQVILPNVKGQPSNQTVTINSDVTLRNSPYMLGQY